MKDNNETSIDYNKLFDGIRNFKSKDFVPNQIFFEELANSQNPHTLFIGCSDSRVIPNFITKTIPGELFVVRNIANLVPNYDIKDKNFVATSAVIEYAVKHLNVNNIVVCGHSNCGGCEVIYYEEKELNKMPHTKKWLELMKPIKNVIQNKIDTKEISMEQRGLFTEQMNVLEQINHLMRYPYIRSRVKKTS